MDKRKRLGKEASNYRHGGHLENRPEYNSWRGMLDRCTNPKHDHYNTYGAVGIKVCERWQRPTAIGFKNFLEDMGKKPTPKHSIDRIDNSGNYEPSNCRWATQTEQIRNSSNAKYYTVDGIYDTQSGHLSRVKDRSRSFVAKMMARGMTFEEALKTPNDSQQKLRDKRHAALLAKIADCARCGARCKTVGRKYCSYECSFKARWGEDTVVSRR